MKGKGNKINGWQRQLLDINDDGLLYLKNVFSIKKNKSYMRGSNFKNKKGSPKMVSK